MKNKRLYNIWAGMKQRCINPNNSSYSSYGGKGLKVCDEWFSDFKVFQEWALSNGYIDDLSIDRLNNQKGYEPENCRWATTLQQGWNREGMPEECRRISLGDSYDKVMAAQCKNNTAVRVRRLGCIEGSTSFDK